MKRLLIIILGLFLFAVELTNFGGGKFAEKYVLFAICGIGLAVIFILLRRR